MFELTGIRDTDVDCIYIYSRATLARSLHHVSRANNNRFAIVVCSNLELHYKFGFIMFTLSSH